MGRVHPCCSEEKKVRKGLWSPEEDERLASHIARFGVSCWSSIPELAGLQRCGKSCRLRWMNYLRPDLKRGRFSQQEEGLIVALHKALGNSWSQIAARLPGRSDNEIKNFWNARMRKKLRQKEAAAGPGSKEPAAGRGRNYSAEDGRTNPAPAVFDPFPSCQDHASAGSSCDDSSAAGSCFSVGDAAAATCPAAVADADDDRNATAAADPGVTPPTMTATSSSRACATDARGSCDDGFLTAMVDDASFLFGDFYLHGDNDGQISFWDAHAFS